MAYKKLPQKLISFTENQADLDKVSADMDNGWIIISLVRNGSYYVGIMEQQINLNNNVDSSKLFIPPRKKIKITG